jgi:hypothetical protein
VHACTRHNKTCSAPEGRTRSRERNFCSSSHDEGALKTQGARTTRARVECYSPHFHVNVVRALDRLLTRPQVSASPRLCEGSRGSGCAPQMNNVFDDDDYDDAFLQEMDALVDRMGGTTSELPGAAPPSYSAATAPRSTSLGTFTWRGGHSGHPLAWSPPFRTIP